jgi:hypothetical protein
VRRPSGLGRGQIFFFHFQLFIHTLNRDWTPGEVVHLFSAPVHCRSFPRVVPFNYVLSFVADEVIFKANPAGQPAFIDTILGTGYEKMSFGDIRPAGVA